MPATEAASKTSEQVPWFARAFSGLGTDIRQAFRQLRKSKGFAATTLLTLTLCIGATTAIFSVVYALALKPLPFDEPDRIVELYGSAVRAGLNKMPSNAVQYLDYKENSTCYETLALWRQTGGILGEDGSLERITGAQASADMFQLLRVQPVLGSFFTPDQNKPGEDAVVVLTESFWESKFDRDPEVVGKTIRVDGETLTVVGVVERAMESFDARVKFIRAISWGPRFEHREMRYSLTIQLFGRLASGVTIGQAGAEAKTIEQRYYEVAPAQMREFIERSGVTVEVGGLQSARVKPIGSTLYLLQAGVAFVLLIGCVNVANLLLARSNARQSELAIRFSLGAGRGAIAQQLLTESMVLAGLGSAFGVGLAWAALRVINRYTSEVLPQAMPVTLDRGVLGFAIALTLIVGLFVGLIPLVHVLRTNLSAIINSNSRGASAGRGIRSLSSLLAVAQVAVALVLLTGGGLLILAFHKAVNVDPGLDMRGVVGAGITLPRSYRESVEVAEAIRDRLEIAMNEIPGVTSAAMAYNTPFRGGVGINAFVLEHDPLPPGSPQPGAFRVSVTPGYLETMRLRLLEGRFFEKGDTPNAQRLFVVDESFANKFFPGKSAVGGHFSFGGRPEGEADWPTIIGVVRDVPHNGVEDRSGNPFVYQMLQGQPGGFGLFLRTERPVRDTMAAMREKIAAIDPAIGVFDPATLESAIDASYNTRRAVMLLLVAFAALALFLSALGIYGVLAYDVSQRTREIGIRGALGATRKQIITMILQQGLWRAGTGLATGLIAAWLLSRYMTSLLYEVEPTDPAVYASVSGVLLIVSSLASYLPARRAAKIDPIVALREE